MNKSELKDLINGCVKEAVSEETAKYKETKRKYADVFDTEQQEYEIKKAVPVEQGIRMVRLAKLALMSNNDPERALILLEKGCNYKNGRFEGYPDDNFIKQHLKTMKSLGVTVGSEGGFLVPEILSQEVIPILYSQTAIFELGTRRLDMPSGNLSIPRLVAGATSFYQGENLAAKKSQPRFEPLRLSSKKLFTLVPTSNDLIRNSSATADSIIRDDMIQQMKLRLEQAALYGDGSTYVPLGIKNTAGITKASPSRLIDADDLATLVGILKSKNVPMTAAGWLFNSTLESQIRNLKTATGAYIYRSEMDEKKAILGIPYRTTEQIALGIDSHGLTDLYLADWSEFIFASEVDFEVSTSSEASYDDGSGLVSAFSNDQTVIKILSKHDFGCRHTAAFLNYTFYTK